MDELAKFDAEFKQINSYEILVANFIKYIFTFVGMCLIITVPLTDDKVIPVVAWQFLGVCVVVHLKVVLYFMRSGKRTSVYKVLSNTPINRQMYVKVRCKYLFSYLLKLVIAVEIMQIIGLLLEDMFNAVGIVRTLIYLVIIFMSYILIGIADIYMSTR